MGKVFSLFCARILVDNGAVELRGQELRTIESDEEEEVEEGGSDNDVLWDSHRSLVNRASLERVPTGRKRVYL